MKIANIALINAFFLTAMKIENIVTMMLVPIIGFVTSKNSGA